MPRDHIPELDEIVKRCGQRLNELIAEVHRDFAVLREPLQRTEDPHAIVEAVESDRLLRHLPDDADVM